MLDKIKYNLSILFFASLFLLSPFNAFAEVGVGVGIGKIVMDKPLSPGGVYTLPSLPVINTGDEYSQYTVMPEYRENVKEMRPGKNWFSFDPSSFGVDPGNSQDVNIVLTIPSDAKPGDYFVFLQAQPIKEQELVDNSNTMVNIAAAAKLYFTVSSANIFQAIYYKIATLYDKFYPYDAMVLGFIIFVVIVFIVKDKFNIKISSKEKKEDNIVE
jgi:hypothetical protein